MSNVYVNETYLEDIADSIRSKLGVQTTYKPSQMAEAIESIETGGITPTGEIEINANGTYDVTQYASAEVDVPQSGITPTGTVSITQNGTTDVTNYASASVSVPNSYSASDEGKVVSNGALVAQTSDTVTQNGTVDTTLIDSLLVNVSGGGTSGYEFTWATSQVVTIGANSITNTSGVQTYFSSYSYDIVLLLSALTTRNQFVAFLKSTPSRYRDGSVSTTVVGNSYDAVLVEGTQYLLLKI